MFSRLPLDSSCTEAYNEDAMSFLHSHGWDTETIRKDHYTVDDQLVDEVMMAYRLD